MASLRNAAALVGLSLLAACSNTMSPTSRSVDRPIQGAFAPAGSEDSASSTQMSAPVRTSDNRPADSRSGLNSDPNNPNGAPGNPRKW